MHLWQGVRRPGRACGVDAAPRVCVCVCVCTVGRAAVRRAGVLMLDIVLPLVVLHYLDQLLQRERERERVWLAGWRMTVGVLCE